MSCNPPSQIFSFSKEVEKAEAGCCCCPRHIQVPQQPRLDFEKRGAALHLCSSPSHSLLLLANSSLQCSWRFQAQSSPAPTEKSPEQTETVSYSLSLVSLQRSRLFLCGIFACFFQVSLAIWKFAFYQRFNKCRRQSQIFPHFLRRFCKFRSFDIIYSIHFCVKHQNS